jgi:hypothetical protein
MTRIYDEDRELAIQRTKDNVNIDHAEKIVQSIALLVQDKVIDNTQGNQVLFAISKKMGWPL